MGVVEVAGEGIRSGGNWVSIVSPECSNLWTAIWIEEGIPGVEIVVEDAELFGKLELEVGEVDFLFVRTEWWWGWWLTLWLVWMWCSCLCCCCCCCCSRSRRALSSVTKSLTSRSKPFSWSNVATGFGLGFNAERKESCAAAAEWQERISVGAKPLEKKTKN